MWFRGRVPLTEIRDRNCKQSAVLPLNIVDAGGIAVIERIIRIRNLGRFASYQASGDVTMRKLTLIYGENGSGKTTLCALMILNTAVV